MPRKKQKLRFPTKEKVLQALAEGGNLNGFEKYALIIEYKKISGTIGVVTGELLQNNKILLRGKLVVFPETQPDSFDWGLLKAGENYFQGYSLDYKGETLIQLIKQGLKKSIKNGRFPFLPK